MVHNVKCLLFAAALMVCTCAQKQDGNDIIVMQDAGPASDFVSQVRAVRLIPLDETDSHLLGSNAEMYPLGQDYLLVDKQNANIFRFSENGDFINSIGRKGNGPGEFAGISNVQISDGNVTVFSFPGNKTTYDADGGVLSEETYERFGSAGYAYDGGMLTYFGYVGTGRDRLEFIDSSRKTKGFLPTTSDVINLSLGNDIFSASSDGNVCILDSYASEIYKFKDGACGTYLDFDFGKYSINDQFFDSGDVMKSAEYLMNSPYALIYRYTEDRSHKLVQVNLSEPGGKGQIRYGYYSDGEWIWFSLGEYDSQSASGPFRYFNDGRLYCVVEPEKIDAFAALFMDKITDRSAVEKAKSKDSHVIAEIVLD